MCVQIIKSGPNKGKNCGLKIVNGCLCRRHYNLSIPKINNNTNNNTNNNNINN